MFRCTFFVPGPTHSHPQQQWGAGFGPIAGLCAAFRARKRLAHNSALQTEAKDVRREVRCGDYGECWEEDDRWAVETTKVTPQTLSLFAKL